MKKKQTLILSVCITPFLLLGITGMKFHNRIYAWTLGDVQSLYAQAESLYQQKEYEEARKLYAKLAGIDSASRCQYVLGDMYFQGQGGERDYDKARRLFIQAAEGGNADAQNNLGYIYTLGVRTRTSTKPRNGYAWGRLKVIRKQWSAWEAFTETVGEY